MEECQREHLLPPVHNNPKVTPSAVAGQPPPLSAHLGALISKLWVNVPLPFSAKRGLYTAITPCYDYILMTKDVVHQHMEERIHYYYY